MAWQELSSSVVPSIIVDGRGMRICQGPTDLLLVAALLAREMLNIFDSFDVPYATPMIVS